MVLYDGPKPKGRFIKKDSALIKCVKVTDFNLMDICDKPVVLMDNIDGSILHSYLHDKEEFDRVVLPYPQIDKDFRGDAKQTTLKPLNFTEDWRRQQQRSHNRKHTGLDDDEYDYELEMQLEREAQEEKEMASKEMVAKTSVAKQRVESAEKSVANREAIPQENKVDGESQAEMANVEAAIYSPDAAKDLPTDIGDADHENLNVHKSNLDTLDHFGKSLSQVTPSTENSEQSTLDSLSAIPDQEGGDFIPMDSENTPEGTNAETAATEQYQGQLDLDGIPSAVDPTLGPEPAGVQAQQQNEEIQMSQAQMEEFKQQVRQEEQEKTEAIVTQVKDVIKEFEGLKKDVLANVQENFKELSQAVAESILRKEFKLNPETFGAVIQKAVDEAVKDDEFKVLLNPETFETLKTMNIPDLEKYMVADESIAEGDFKVESNLSVVDGNLANLVDQLIEQADTQLFDDTEEEEASTDENKDSDDVAG